MAGMIPSCQTCDLDNDNDALQVPGREATPMAGEGKPGEGVTGPGAAPIEAVLFTLNTHLRRAEDGGPRVMCQEHSLPASESM